MMRRVTIALLILSAAGTAACTGHHSDDPANGQQAAANQSVLVGDRRTAAPDAADAKAARALVHRYYNLVEKGDFAAARQLWGHDGADAGGDAAALAASYAPYSRYKVTVGDPTDIHSTGGLDCVNVAVSVDSVVAKTGRAKALEGPVMLRRDSNAKTDAASDSRGWRIWGADIRAPH